MKLIKINPEHYIIVDDSEIKENSFIECERKIGRVVKILNEDSFPYLCADGLRYSLSGSKVVTHSTQPLDKDIKPLSLLEIEEVVNGYNIQKLAENHHEYEGFVSGFRTHQEIAKDKLFTIDDMRKAYELGLYNEIDDNSYKLKELFNTLLPKMEWDVIFENNKLKLT